MPRAQARLCVIVLFSFAIGCHAPPSQRSAERGSFADSGAYTGGVATVALPAAGPDPSIEATVKAVTDDVKALRDAPPAVAAARLPAHEQLVNGMLNNFESRIREMHVHADPSWTSVIDSVRTDLARLPAMPSASLASFLPQHLNRVMRIVVCIQMVKS